jgi:hypothetical protein
VSWLRPTCAETEVTYSGLRSSGTEPNLSTFCSWVACAWVKLPVICALPPGMGLLIVGDDTTLPSRAMATWSSTSSFTLPAW